MPKVLIVILSIVVIVTFLAITIPFIATIIFNQNVKKEVRELFNNNAGNKNEIITEADLEGLPLSVQQWLKNSKVIGKERIRTVRLKQSAFMRLKEDSAWMPAEVEQYFTVEKPGFIWKAQVKTAPLVYFTGRDRYDEGKGHMLIKVLSLMKVADAKGKEIDQGTMVRYLAEMVWFPTAALSNYILWEEIDSNSAKATMSYGGVAASGIFTFNEKGEAISLVAERYGEFDGQYLMKTWSVTMRDHKQLDGIWIPVKGEVTWKLDSGDFNWYQFEIKEIEYNKQFV